MTSDTLNEALESDFANIDLRYLLGRMRTRLLHHPVEVVAFSDEEGVRFQSTYLGSRALAGTLLESGILQKRDHSGMSVIDVLERFGFETSPGAIRRVAVPANKVIPCADGLSVLKCLALCVMLTLHQNAYAHMVSTHTLMLQIKAYVEIHIEQGPVLQSSGRALGPVSAIAGQTRLHVTIHGVQGHAGTVPMHTRNDPVPAVSEVILQLEKICNGGKYGQVFR